MDDNPYQAPQSSGAALKRNPFAVGTLAVISFVVATDLILGGIVKTFVWGISEGNNVQLLQGLVSLAAGVLIVERFLRYLLAPYRSEPDSTPKIVAAIIWVVIAVGVAIDAFSVAVALL